MAETEGSIQRINWDSSWPREELVYSYCTERGYSAGSYWRWFEPCNAREVRVGDRIVLRYNPEDPDEAVFLKFTDRGDG